VAPPAAGKIVMGAALIAERRTSTVLVHRRPLLKWWSSRLKRFLGIEPGDVGSSGRAVTATGVDLAMIQFVIAERTSTSLGPARWSLMNAATSRRSRSRS
jgi:superfamily II DNA or RNA helicase